MSLKYEIYSEHIGVIFVWGHILMREMIKYRKKLCVLQSKNKKGKISSIHRKLLKRFVSYVLLQTFYCLFDLLLFICFVILNSTLVEISLFRTYLLPWIFVS